MKWPSCDIAVCRMRSFMQITVLLLCSHSWICESQTVEVYSGENVTLFCSNISQTPTQTDWFRVINRTKPSCISSMYGAESKASYCVGIQNEKFEMSSNMTTVFLQIKQVDPWDSGLYFCGFYVRKHTVIGSATKLIIKANEDSNDEGDSNNKKEADQLTDLIPGISGALSVLLSVTVIVLVVKYRRLQTASRVKVQKERNKLQNLDSDDLKYAALSFQAKTKRSRRPAPPTELESHVVYAATR
ncbi:uncharacterized protein LOC124880933 isoform X2 [Girardinichthys multiradiatus]|uniref:uncharacterized protein LOC124880933 isoform X2 n=1 Tax=Girardinichthys multiradiatus TaxID=208333 RepID=UPI001FAD1506|nr:uncharacterized protein LOC124880933 isoform X2 [Girardinichthys multiradiatus]